VCRSGQGGGGRPLGKSPLAPRCERSARKRSTKLGQALPKLTANQRRLCSFCASLPPGEWAGIPIHLSPDSRILYNERLGPVCSAAMGEKG
jgi:hypothetical protein